MVILIKEKIGKLRNITKRANGSICMFKTILIASKRHHNNPFWLAMKNTKEN